MKRKPRFFATPGQWRSWLEKNHAHVKELSVGFHKKSSARPSITWPESVDEALCFGWIDGVPNNLNETSYTIRFTPRKPRSTWSALNIRRAAELKREARAHPTGLAESPTKPVAAHRRRRIFASRLEPCTEPVLPLPKYHPSMQTDHEENRNQPRHKAELQEELLNYVQQLLCLLDRIHHPSQTPRLLIRLHLVLLQMPLRYMEPMKVALNWLCSQSRVPV
jgi:hypothetical protein